MSERSLTLAAVLALLCAAPALAQEASRSLGRIPVPPAAKKDVRQTDPEAKSAFSNQIVLPPVKVESFVPVKSGTASRMAAPVAGVERRKTSAPSKPMAPRLKTLTKPAKRPALRHSP